MLLDLLSAETDVPVIGLRDRHVSVAELVIIATAEPPAAIAAARPATTAGTGGPWAVSTIRPSISSSTARPSQANTTRPGDATSSEPVSGVVAGRPSTAQSSANAVTSSASAEPLASDPREVLGT